MRLKHIKLAGFKSFVDPTVVPLPSNLVAVVGPNGCGKSNIIDAVRWVIGESSAKQLRGESMADIIFNGSTTRKPLAQASIELIFEDTLGQLTGEYAQYEQIAIRREVTREGTSDFYLNGTHCRRRDILDVFFGTGVNPRSYAIIEQNMISSLIEAKPEELRYYFEEASGITRYKDRRKETLQRIEHTQENLARLHDIQQEMDRQLRTLQRQSQAATRFKKYKEQTRRLKAEMLWMEWKGIYDKINQADAQLKTVSDSYETLQAERDAMEASLLKKRALQSEKDQAYQDIQTHYYQLGHEISNLERHVELELARQKQLQEDIQQLENSAKKRAEDILLKNQTALSHETRLKELQPQRLMAEKEVATTRERLLRVEKEYADWQQAWHRLSHTLGQLKEQDSIETTKIQQWEDRLQEIVRRKKLFEQEADGLDVSISQQKIAGVQEQLAQQKQEKATLEDEMASIQQHIIDCQTENDGAERQLGSLHQGLVTKSRLRGSLMAEQEIALGKSDKNLVKWLEGQHLSESTRLAENLSVEMGWETAVETVLNDTLQAICVEAYHPFLSSLENHAEHSVILVQAQTSIPETSLAEDSLFHKVKGPASLKSLLGSIHTAFSLEEALEKAKHLQGNESVVTRSGLWISSNWVRMVRNQKPTGVLVRKKELQKLNEAIAFEEKHVKELQTLIQNNKIRMTEMQQRLSTQRSELSHLLQAIAQGQSDIKLHEQSIQHTHNRTLQIQKELEDLCEREKSYGLQIEQSRLKKESNHQQWVVENERQQNRAEQGDTLRKDIQNLRHLSEEQSKRMHHLIIEEKTSENEYRMLFEQLNYLNEEQGKNEASKQIKHTEWQQTKMPIEKSQHDIQGLLSEQLKLETSLTQARVEKESMTQSIAEIESHFKSIQEKIETLRQGIQQHHIEHEGNRVRLENLETQIQACGWDKTVLESELDPTATVENWKEQQEDIERRIERLGPINLAAIDEYKIQNERKEYLEQQCRDLQDALETLQKAIQKMDKETRMRFRETFEKINEHFKNFYPKVFDGGSGYLELTDDDVLTAGIKIIARPPGKRNTSIHILSGGEKALIALCLVFSIFELNPAPFCLLDEVDAPLDDYNITRFCSLVKEMSQRVQFLVITHNKLTMEMANHLLGVTMNEPGVSRIVAVDVTDALAIVDATQ